MAGAVCDGVRGEGRISPLRICYIPCAGFPPRTLPGKISQQRAKHPELD